MSEVDGYDLAFHVPAPAPSGVSKVPLPLLRELTDVLPADSLPFMT
ncbi:hypothetical protein SK854_07685 [Lentzea sp. BCCO 10_0061]|uniref:Uncharacterized protein n=1 Tax=Lentzea sokolovensis TaxID=3095429 RepID=A0ABU4UR68_9PSEU|nr:hypothetical protein [Lentzea sp. BCCO 10_0061]MDX8141985.1 hypothetical protein [Lentzea sp. BCCO 10_0061]